MKKKEQNKRELRPKAKQVVKRGQSQEQGHPGSVAHEQRIKEPPTGFNIRRLLRNRLVIQIALASLTLLIMAVLIVLFLHYGTVKGIGLAKDITTAIAIVVGGAWAYITLVQTRQRNPRAITNLSVTHWILPNGSTLIRALVKVENIGNVLLSLGSVVGRVYKIMPWPAMETITNENGIEVEWPCIDERTKEYERRGFELEPGEKDEVIFDMILEEEAQLVCVYTYLENIKKKEKEGAVGWCNSSLYEISKGEGGE